MGDGHKRLRLHEIASEARPLLDVADEHAQEGNTSGSLKVAARRARGRRRVPRAPHLTANLLTVTFFYCVARVTQTERGG